MPDFVIRGSWVGGLSQNPPSFTAATRADLMIGISDGQYSAPCFVYVAADETQGGVPNLYFNGNGAPEIVGAAAGAAAALPQVFATYAALQAAIAAGQFTAPRSVVVTTDETNDNTRTFYNWDGTALQWVPTVDA